ncbi:MAG: glycosyltransferase [Burkholderiaceae bacterium]|nr:glycosyltransferase [Burkholderiaceae bacterium]
MHVLFVTWDGPQVTYLESLFLPIFERLAINGVSFQVLQFTWGGAERIALARQACEQAGVGYRAVSVWRWPRAAGAMLTALAGARHVKKAVQTHHIDVVMARSTLPALATMLALRGSQCRMVFDADGLPLDERVDFAGQSPSSLVHRLLRDVEAQAVRQADVVLTRSAKAVEILHARAGAGTSVGKFHVVSNGRDSKIFRPTDLSASFVVRKDLKIGSDAPMIIYAGSLGGKYCLEEMLRLFGYIYARREDSKFFVLTSSPDLVGNMLKKFPSIRQAINSFFAPSSMVAKYMSCADLGLALIRPSYSMQAASAIKMGEYLLSGLPVIGTAGIGDSKKICAQGGYVLSGMEEKDLMAAADWFIDSVLPQRECYRARSRAVGLNQFSLEASATSYRQALQPLNREP